MNLRRWFTEPRLQLQALKRLHRLQRSKSSLTHLYSHKRLLHHQLRNNLRKRRSQSQRKQKSQSQRNLKSLKSLRRQKSQRTRKRNQRKRRKPRKFTKKRSLRLSPPSQLNLQRRNLISSQRVPKLRLNNSNSFSWPRRKRSEDFRSTSTSKTPNKHSSHQRTLS